MEKTAVHAGFVNFFCMAAMHDGNTLNEYLNHHIELILMEKTQSLSVICR